MTEVNGGPAGGPAGEPDKRRGHRRGGDTKGEIRAVALELFVERGYDATSLREIAERLGITKAAVYYHFSSKEEIVRSLFEDHLSGLQELIDWASEQSRVRAPGPELRREVIDRMVALTSGRGQQAMRFALANQHVVKEMHRDHQDVVGRLRDLFAAVTGPGATLEEKLRVRVALLSVNLVFFAAQDLDASDAEVADAARSIAHMLDPGE